MVTHPARYSGKTLLCWQQFYGIAIAFFCRLFHLKKRFRLVIMTFIYKPRSGFAGRLFERFVRYAVTSDAVDRILLTTRATPRPSVCLFPDSVLPTAARSRTTPPPTTTRH